jgi:hypothetical protein
VLKPIDRDQTHPVIRWLMTDARRRTDACEFLEAFALELRAAGVDVSRISTGVPILHPQIFSFSGLWQLDKGTTERLYRAGPDSLAIMSRSPIRIAYESGGPVRCGLTAPALALHVGDVLYGNIGSDTRLDFTVIGPAVNLGARIESMCRQLGRSLLLSSGFVSAGGIAAESLGRFPLKGVAAAQEIFLPKIG